MDIKPAKHQEIEQDNHMKIVRGSTRRFKCYLSAMVEQGKLLSLQEYMKTYASLKCIKNENL